MRRVSTIVSIVVLVAQMAAAQKKTPIADSWIAAWNSHDVEKVVAIFTADVLHEDATSVPPTTDLQSCANSLHLSLMQYRMRNLSW